MRGKYMWEVIDGTRRHPRGYIGRYESKTLAVEARWRLCRMGGYVIRIYGPVDVRALLAGVKRAVTA
jgi:hypothetical protein